MKYVNMNIFKYILLQMYTNCNLTTMYLRIAKRKEINRLDSISGQMAAVDDALKIFKEMYEENEDISYESKEHKALIFPNFNEFINKLNKKTWEKMADEHQEINFKNGYKNKMEIIIFMFNDSTTETA